MAVYLMSYDLHERSWEFYSQLNDALTKAGAERVLLSQWVIVSAATAVALRDWLGQLVGRTGPQDRVLVNEVANTNWAGFAMLEGYKRFPGAN